MRLILEGDAHPPVIICHAAEFIPALWRALASPWRRRLLDQLRIAPATTGELAAGLPELSRCVNHLNPVPLREWYERWVQPMADTGAAELLALKRAAEKGTPQMPDAIEPIRTGWLTTCRSPSTEPSGADTFDWHRPLSWPRYPVISLVGTGERGGGAR